MVDDERPERPGQPYGAAWAAPKGAPVRRATAFLVAAAVALVAAVAAAVVTFSQDNHPRPVRAIVERSTSAGAAPAYFWAFSGPRVVRVDARTGRLLATVPTGGHRVGAVGSSASGDTGYLALAGDGCHVDVERDRLVAGQEIRSTVATVAGGLEPARGSIAVSVDERWLALVVTACAGTHTDDLVVLDLKPRIPTQRRWHGSPGGSLVVSPQWSADDRHLAYVTQPCCRDRADGTRVIDVQTSGPSYLQPRVVLPQNAPDGEGPLGPVFWWRGDWAIVHGGTVARFRRTAGRLTFVPVSRGGLPRQVDSVSSDPSGAHLLLVTGNATYRWDAGVLTPLPGRWTLPVW